ncbi:hypothetical protein NX801_24070 [Streptomyces sp. LP05-1]|uniref:Lipoprotein n=1 Tax=Streptomyces pyxinae TaxID=2970734 RepID=A0ABT2CMN0_9ACTN|nr:hypothetical protein [Streptomyces sp. LP05-1]MCS0638675.1 hypothetical protein [Streptomyces sp. LP05-1]
MAAKKALVAAVAVCLGATALAGCGSDDGKDADKAFGGKSPDQIAADAVKATREAKSVRVEGTARQPTGNEIGLNFHVDEQDHCTGTITGQGAKAEVLQLGQQVYVRGDQKFWQNSLQGQPGTQQKVQQLQGKWVKSQPNQAGTEGVCDKQAFLAALDSDKSERKGLTKGETTEIDGKDALALVKKQSNGEKTTMYVATEGEPYILKAVTEGGKQPGEVTFSDYNEKVEAKQPPADQVVDPGAAKTSG